MVAGEGDKRESILLVDETLYGRGALLRTCYLFTDRCYVFVSRHDPQHLSVRLTAKAGSTEFEAVAGEFANALLDYQLRQEISRETATVRELIVAKAFAEGNLLDCMSSEPFGQVGNGFKRGSGPSELKLRLRFADAAGVAVQWSLV